MLIEQNKVTTVEKKPVTSPYSGDKVAKICFREPTEDDYSDFELTLKPTPDFYTPLLSRGPLIKVLSPQWLADEIKRLHEEAVKLYEMN